MTRPSGSTRNAAVAKREAKFRARIRIRCRCGGRSPMAGGRLSRRAVFDLPRVVEDVPRRPSNEVTRRPPFAAAGSFGNAVASDPFERVEDRCAESRGAFPGWELRGPGAETRQVALVGAENVVDDLVEVSAASARTLRQLLVLGGVGGAIERPPARLQDRLEPFEVLRRDR